MKTAVRVFRWPWLWRTGWIAMVAAVVAGSLMPAQSIPTPPIPGLDKLEHFVGYLVLSGYAVMLFDTRRAQLRAAVALVVLGVALEFMQGALTASRAADPVDAIVNAAGVLAGLALRGTRFEHGLQWLEQRVAARR